MAGVAVGLRIRGGPALNARLLRIERGISAEIREVMLTTLEQAHTWMIENALTGGTTPTRLKMRTGNLIGSLRVRVASEPGGVIRGELTQDQRYRSARYLPVHEFGAGGAGLFPAIRATRTKFLAIPLNPEAESYQSPRDFPEKLWFLPKPDKQGREAGFWMTGTGKHITPMWRLLQSVTIPARHPFGRTAKIYLPILWNRVTRALERLVINSKSG